MKTVHRALTAGVASVALVATTSGCSGNDDGNAPIVAVVPTSPPATLVVQWTLDEGTDPNQCVSTQSSAIEITIDDPNGNEVGTFQQGCDAFSTSITLGAGSYSGTAILLDGGNQPRTTQVDIDPFTLLANDTLVVPIDFPNSAFLE